MAQAICGKRQLRWSGAALFLLLAVFALSVAPVLAAEGSVSVERRSVVASDRELYVAPVSGSWRNMLQFDQPGKYQYELNRRGPGRTIWGSLTIEVTRTLAGNSLSITYEVDGKRGSLWLRPMAASPLEALVTHILWEDNLDETGMKLVLTPFMFAKWASEFARMDWRTGASWANRGVGNEEFRVDRTVRGYGGNVIYRGSLEKNRRTVLEMDVDLKLPLPEYISWIDGNGGRYEAELR